MDALVSSAESFSDSKVSFCTRRKDVLSETQNSESGILEKKIYPM